MTLGKPVTEATIVASWLKAELDSERFSHLVTRAIKRGGVSEQLIIEPDTNSAEDNARRMQLLRTARSGQLRRFPWRQTEWFELYIESREELGSLYTPFGDTWLAFTNGERLLSKAATFIASLSPLHNPLKHVVGIHEKIRFGISLEPPILITSERRLSKPFTILEGNVRLVSYYLYTDMAFPLRTYVGISSKIATWAHSGDTLEDIKNAFRQGVNT